MKFLSLLASAPIAILAALPAHSATLRFLPEGNQLDGDPIVDIETQIGAPITFFLQLDTTGLEDDLVSLEYQVVRDFSELPTPPESFEFFNESLLSFQDFDISSDPATQLATITLSRGDGGKADLGVEPDTSVRLQRDTYRVAEGLSNDGLNDFSVVRVLSATDAADRDITALFDQSFSGVDVQHTEVPEPLPIVGMAAILGAFWTLTQLRSIATSAKHLTSNN